MKDARTTAAMKNTCWYQGQHQLFVLYIMKLLLMIIIAISLQGFTKSYSQNITLSLKNVSLEKVFSEIERQSGFHFVYLKEEIENGKPVTVEVKDKELKTVLDLCLAGQPVTYSIHDRYISIKLREKIIAPNPDSGLNGRIVNEKGEPVAGITVRVKGNDQLQAITDNEGRFALRNLPTEALLLISGAEMETLETTVNGKEFITIRVKTKVSDLDQVVIMAYGETTRRLNTGNIGKVTSEDISKQPVSNPIAALEGRVPGLLITQSSGLNGAAFKTVIRGQNSLLQGSEPFFIVDGVPFAPDNAMINQLTNAASSGPIPGLSPFGLINPADIESIEILKDADATAIYGSRGANGVIIITTKKGKSGKTKLSVNVHSGSSQVTRTMDMLGLKDYLAMRREAFANDGVTPTASSAPDLFLWDTTRYTDIKQELIGGIAKNTDAQVSLSGGTNSTQFLVAAGYHKQTTVFPTDLADKKASLHFNINHTSANKRFGFSFSGLYTANKNELTVSDLTQYIRRPPNMKFFDSTGKPNWQEGGVAFNSLGIIDGNPFAFLYQHYNGRFNTLVSNALLSYKLVPGLSIKVNLGYTVLFSDEISTNSSASIDPNTSQLPSSRFANGNRKTWIVEPQAEYKRSFAKTEINLLVGSTWQENMMNSSSVTGTGYSNDIFLNSLAGAATITASNNFSQYRYTAIFGRLNLNHGGKYLLNITSRRDGSSRFGPASRYSNFGAAGGGWIFSNEGFWKKLFPLISFGKLRASYGITGNDQIGDYRFIDTWTTSSATYGGTASLNPTGLFNPDYAWEMNKKAEGAIELEFLKNRVFLSISYFNNRCGNQLVNYTLPIQTGFSFIGKNLDAVIINRGTEIQINSKNIRTPSFSWTTVFNITFSKNRLAEFPGLSTSSYANTFFIDKSLSTKKVYRFIQVNPATGIYEFEDADRSGTINSADKIAFVSTDPDFYGGLQNTISFKGFQFDIFFEYRKQTGRNYIANLQAPGSMVNQPVIVLERWQHPGDIKQIQRFTTSPGPAFTAIQNYLIGSDAAYANASFVRCKNISLAYSLPGTWCKKIHAEKAQLYMLAQNVFTVTRYKGADPENQNMFILPPLRTITAGISFDF
jgi:TonB-linked SusC/RagA family outer membrane protein